MSHVRLDVRNAVGRPFPQPRGLPGDTPEGDQRRIEEISRQQQERLQATARLAFAAID